MTILSFLVGFVLFWRRNTDVLDVWIIFRSVDTLLEQCNSTLQFINLGLKISNICCNLFENTLLVFFLAVCLKFRVNKNFQQGQIKQNFTCPEARLEKARSNRNEVNGLNIFDQSGSIDVSN